MEFASGSRTVGGMDADAKPPRTTHRDVGSVPKRRERGGAGFTACPRVTSGLHHTTNNLTKRETQCLT